MANEQMTPVQTPQPNIPEDALIIVAVRDMVLFPGAIGPIAIARPKSIAAAQQALREQRPIGIVLQRNPETDDPGPDDLYRVGTIANIVRYITAPDGSHHIVCQGVQRVRILDFLPGTAFPAARMQQIPEPTTTSPEIEARFLNLQRQAIEAIELLPQAPPELIAMFQNTTAPGALADLATSTMDIKPQDKQEILETIDLSLRVEKVSKRLAERLEVLRISNEIGQKTRAAFDERQREAILREQMATIQRQLGEGDGKAAEVAELTEAIAKAKMPPDAEAHASKELRRYARMPEAAGEAGMVRTYLDWLIELPWALPEEKPIDIKEARRILDADHYGLEKIKSRIIEYLAVRKLAPQGKAPILCFVGPPGVGKTSLGQSIARATGREFVRVSLGGVHDEAEIRGHRRTYIGALPGNVIQSIRKAGTKHALMMLDEIDKLGGGSFHGDPSSALLEVLEIAGYTEEEKLKIAVEHLVAKQVKNHGLTSDYIRFTDAAIRQVVRGYTREAGVRNLEREIGSLCRKVARRRAEGNEEPIEITPEVVIEMLGAPKFLDEEMEERTKDPGVAVGMAWTPAGGEVLFIEASRMAGTGSLTLTGQLGDVMKESARAALSWIRAHAKEHNIDPDFFKNAEMHVHVPSGAIPKDGPSAGVTIATAIASELTGRPVRGDIAMTGEITLSGRVLPIGGVKEKVLAARRVGINEVILPKQNGKNVNEDLTPELRKDLVVHLVSTIDEVLALALQPVATDARPVKPVEGDESREPDKPRKRASPIAVRP
jgi:ATP-dependent Lon protease